MNENIFLNFFGSNDEVVKQQVPKASKGESLIGMSRKTLDRTILVELMNHFSLSSTSLC